MPKHAVVPASDVQPGQPKAVTVAGREIVVFNVGGYYEKYGLSVRLNYQKRTEWLDSLGAPADGGNQFWASDDELGLAFIEMVQFKDLATWLGDHRGKRPDLS